MMARVAFRKLRRIPPNPKKRVHSLPLETAAPALGESGAEAATTVFQGTENLVERLFCLMAGGKDWGEGGGRRRGKAEGEGGEEAEEEVVEEEEDVENGSKRCTEGRESVRAQGNGVGQGGIRQERAQMRGRD